MPDPQIPDGLRKAFAGWLAWLWRTRNCGHLRRRRVYGADWMIYGPRYRCLDCGRTLSRDRQRVEARDEQEGGGVNDECGNCALEADHWGPCAWICNDCGGTGRCPGCNGTGGEDDVQLCDYCDGGGGCLHGCDDGMVTA